jgi:glycogen phosphorylase
MESRMIDFKKTRVAYFSMEIGVDGKMPTYSGGLGVLAGDMLRSASDMSVPIVGISLLYKKGYFKQKIDSSGFQKEQDEKWEPSDYLKKLPNTIKVRMRGRDVSVAAWLYILEGVTGNLNPILFLDTDLPENSEHDRQITHHLYGRNEEYRLSQEIILGIGGVKYLNSLGCNIERYHMNEGHSALLALELYRSESGNKLENVRKKCVFTTHTPVPAGHDQFSRELAESMLGEYIPEELKRDLFYDNRLNMTYLGLRFSSHINGVAKKHKDVSRAMFPGYNIESITNGVHSAFWASPFFQRLYDKYIPNWREDPFNLRYIMGVPKEKIWSAHIFAKEKLISYVNKKYGAEMNSKAFTIGFARRAASYKRGELLLSDIEKLKEIAKKFKGGVQIIYSGKAHPNDQEGKEIIKRIISKIGELNGHIKMCFIEDYNINVAKIMVAGVDVWLNTPLRPKEASGTSGMKAAHNGVPHLSILDGWWLEGHIENVTGWSIGAHPEKSIENNQQEDIEDLYAKLEYVILPTFYESRDKWIDIMRHAIAINASFFNTHRMVNQYVTNSYFE